MPTWRPRLGGIGERVTSRRQLQGALGGAVAERGRSYLVEIILGRGASSSTLARFVEAVTAKHASARISG